jgi:hypothetical protein
MRRTLPALLTLSLLFAGCRAKEHFDHASAAAELARQSSLDVIKEAANEKYTPPADGKLTEKQVQMYLTVREREREIAQVARQQAQQHADASAKAGEKSLAGMMEGFRTIGSVADMFTADVRAAKALHFNTQEYLWVRGQVLAASGSAYSEKFSQAANAGMDSAYQQMKKSFDEAKDEETRKVYAGVLAGYDRSRREMRHENQKEDPAVAYNRQMISKYESALHALSSELARYGEKPGEVRVR